MKMQLQLLIAFFYLTVHGTIGTSIREKLAAMPGVNPDELSHDIRGDMVFSDEYGTSTIGLWPDGTIPYKITGRFGYSGRELIKRAMREIEDVTCIRFVPRTYEAIYIKITSYNDGCYSHVGYVGKSFNVNLENPGCVHFGVILHELAHAIGLIHEHSRNDRDNYVDVEWENIARDGQDEFDKYSIDLYEGKYDYSSIMHYSEMAFSKNGEPTLRKKRYTNKHMGQRERLSPGDIDTINRRYSCEKTSDYDYNTDGETNTNDGQNPWGSDTDNSESRPSTEETENWFSGYRYTTPDTDSFEIDTYKKPSTGYGYYTKNTDGSSYVYIDWNAFWKKLGF